MLEGKEILVTGGCGFIGSNLATELAGKNGVSVMDNLSSGRESNIREIKDRISFMRGDIRDFDILNEAAKGKGIIFHTAANIFIQRSLEDPRYDIENNVIGTVNVLEACRRNDVDRMVFSSSCAVYGEADDLPIGEGHPVSPISPYAVSKHSAEEFCRLYANLYGIDVVILRYFNVYGRNQDPSSPYSGVISVFLKNLAEKRPFTIHGDGNQTRDFVNVSDVVLANVLASVKKDASGKTFNIGTGRETSVNSLVRILDDISGENIKVVKAERRKGDIRKSCADITYAEKILGFKPRVGLEDGLKGML